MPRSRCRRDNRCSQWWMGLLMRAKAAGITAGSYACPPPYSRDVCCSQWWMDMLVSAAAAARMRPLYPATPATQPRARTAPERSCGHGAEVSCAGSGRLRMPSGPAAEMSSARSGGCSCCCDWWTCLLVERARRGGVHWRAGRRTGHRTLRRGAYVAGNSGRPRSDTPSGGRIVALKAIP